MIEKLALYLGKMCLHDYKLANKRPSTLAAGVIYVTLKIAEQIKKKSLINTTIVNKLLLVSKTSEDELLEISRVVLFLAQNFDSELPGLGNLKSTHFGIIT